NSNSMKGAMKVEYISMGNAGPYRRLLSGGDAGCRLFVEGLAHLAGLQKILGRQHLRWRPPSEGLARQQQGFRKRRLDQLKVVQRCEHCATLAMPSFDDVEEIGRGLGIDRGERLIQHDELRILEQEPREQRPLHLTA